MIRRVVALLLTAGLLMAMIPMGALAEEDMELVFSPDELVQDKSEEDESEKSDLDKLKDMNAAIMEALGKKDWEALAEKVKLSGDWRNDLVNLAQSQVGYQAEKDGMTLYTRWAGLEAASDWTTHFINWVADKIGLNTKEFPQGWTYKSLQSKMNDLKAVKKISRSTYPASGDLALIETNGQKLVGIVVYVSNDYASVIHGDDNGRVTKETYQVGGREFKNYIDLNVLMERAGIEVGKGGVTPVIPEGGVAAWTNTNAVYMRKEPTTASKSLTTVKKAKTAVLVTSAQMQDDGYIWYGVEYKNYVGFIRGDLLNLDLSAIQAVTPVPEKKPETTPAPGCAYCAKASLGLALPVECCYEHLTSMSMEDAAAFMKELLKDDTSTFVQYLSCTAAHVKAGAEELLCLGKECGVAAWTMPSPLHDDNCPWHMAGLASQERVVNIEVREIEAGQETMIFFDIYGANSYQWHEVKSVVNADGTVTETDTIIEGEKSAAVVVTAKREENTTYSYYCLATIVANGMAVEVASKSTVLSVGDAPIVADAILGEEINFIYTVEGAASYQWYVMEIGPKGEYLEPRKMPEQNNATLTMAADVKQAGAIYYCVALDESGSILKTSTNYSYTIKPVAELTDDDLVKYVDELAHMTLNERYTVLNTTWNISISQKDKTTLAAKVKAYWEASLKDVYPNLLCSCGKSQGPGPAHSSGCAWYIPGNSQSSCSTFGEECAIVTSWVTRNASPMEIYNYLATLESAAYDKLLPHVYAAHPQAKHLLCSCMDLYTTLVVPGQLHDASCAWYLSEEKLDELDRTNATDYTYDSEGDTVNIKVPEGAFQQEYVVEVTVVTPDADMMDAVLNNMDATGTHDVIALSAFDISFVKRTDGVDELQPAAGAPVALTFEVSTAGIPAEESYYLYVYHIEDDGTPEVVAGPVEVTYGTQQIEVQAKAFSVYTVLLTTDACAFCSENEECVYDGLILMPAYGQYSMLNRMSEAEFDDFMSDYQKHVKAGDPELLCSCEDGLVFGNIKAPGTAHDSDCPWFEKYSVTVDVIGFPVTLSYPDMLAGMTYQWYKGDMETGMLIGETQYWLEVPIPAEPELYYLLVTFSDQSVDIRTYYVAPQTTVLGSYVNYLLTMMDEWTQTYEEYVDFAYEYITDTCDFEVVGEDGNTYCLADAILSYWYQTSNDWTAPLLCSCVISEAVEADEIMLHPDAKHHEDCAWYKPSPVLQLTPTVDDDQNVTYVLSVLGADGEEIVIAVSKMLDDKYHYFQDVNTGLYVAYLYIDEEDKQWIIPLKSEKQFDEEEPAN